MLNIALTFDHELFFGRNFLKEEEVLIRPTSRIARVLGDSDVSGTFFTDVCSIFRYKELGLSGYPELMTDQLRSLIGCGQDVQLHIHSHWYNSVYDGGVWKFDARRYRIHSYGFGGGGNALSAESIIREGRTYLESLLKPLDGEYRCIAFRAGGFCLQPLPELLAVLIRNGLVIDSSVAKGMFYQAPNRFYSFVDVPTKANWWMNPTQGDRFSPAPDARGGIFEVPIGTLLKRPQKWLLSKQNTALPTTPARGEFMVDSAPDTAAITRLRRRVRSIWSQPMLFSLDRCRYGVLLKMLKEYLRDHPCEDQECYVAVISHPKIFSEEHVENMERFIESVKDRLPMARFVTMRQIHASLKSYA